MSERVIKGLLLALCLLYVGVVVIICIAKTSVINACEHGDQSACAVMQAR